MCKFIEKLKAPFQSNEIEWRIGRSGSKKSDNSVWATALAYVQNRAIQNRLDEVFGVLGWRNEYKEWHGDSQICGISIWDDEKKEWITKWDGADNTNFESTKGGLSDSMKRAAVQWGIGRYLYNLEETFVVATTEKEKGWNYQGANDKKSVPAFYWKSPDLPSWALPNDSTQVQGKPKERNYTEEASECTDTKELKTWFDGLTADEKKEAKGVYNHFVAEYKKAIQLYNEVGKATGIDMIENEETWSLAIDAFDINGKAKEKLRRHLNQKSESFQVETN